MTDPRNKYVSPAIDRTAFNCPHCGAFAHQIWFRAAADGIEKLGTPAVVTRQMIDLSDQDPPEVRATEGHAKMRAHWARCLEGRPFLFREDLRARHEVVNLSLSRCFNCEGLAVWIYNRLVYPPERGDVVAPNPDLPPEIRDDYEEAGRIFDQSPRGAAALLRLSIQKLCRHLGEDGKDLNTDIGSLVKKGLHVRVQQALDAVRVIGNNAVHPGQIDLRDDRAIGERLFGLVNIIAEIMITQPKHIREVYEGLPPGSLAQIKRRDEES